MAQAQANPVLASLLTNTSTMAIYQEWAYAVGYALSIDDQQQDTLFTKIQTALQSDYTHTTSWYRQMALAFMYGYSLPDYGNTYNTTGLSQSTITAAQVVKYCAVVANGDGTLTMKIAGVDGSGNLTPITGGQQSAFVTYIDRIKDAGVKLYILNQNGDLLNYTMDIYYDPLVLDNTGTPLLGGSPVIPAAIESFLSNINTVQFNGELDTSDLITTLKAVGGIKSIFITDIEVQAYNASSFSPLPERYQPISGYFTINTPTYNYIPAP